MMQFQDRYHAGDVLGKLLSTRLGDVTDGIVLGLPRGGVPVAAQVASHLDLPLDVYVARKLGVPGHRELAMGAIATGGVIVLNDAVIRQFEIDTACIDATVEQELIELERREREYRDNRPQPDLTGKDVILVDDGIATGSSMRAAVEATKVSEPNTVIVAVPVAPRSANWELAPLVDQFFVVTTPDPFEAVGWFYRDFTQTSDDEVRQLLAS
ncbi:MAG TPA: phosphoribosyltransferase [Actinobacteria bacterium]|nr:putative phosphoribosyl transferase/MT0597 [bacterium BMS3Bbin02]HDL42338.1 phosphoribosyltransferase [Actinomycetota bacterium]